MEIANTTAGHQLQGRPSRADGHVDYDGHPGGPTLQVAWETSDIVATALVVISVAAALTAIIVAVGLAFGQVSGSDAVKIILGCVGSSTVSGIGSVLVTKPRSKRKHSAA